MVKKKKINQNQSKKPKNKQKKPNQAKTENLKNLNPSRKAVQNSEIIATPQQQFNQVIQADASQKSLFLVHIIWQLQSSISARLNL